MEIWIKIIAGEVVRKSQDLTKYADGLNVDFERVKIFILTRN